MRTPTNRYLSGQKTIDALLWPINFQHKALKGEAIKYSFSGEIFDTHEMPRLLIEQFLRKINEQIGAKYPVSLFDNNLANLNDTHTLQTAFDSKDYKTIIQYEYTYDSQSANKYDIIKILTELLENNKSKKNIIEEAASRNTNNDLTPLTIFDIYGKCVKGYKAIKEYKRPIMDLATSAADLIEFRFKDLQVQFEDLLKYLGHDEMSAILGFESPHSFDSNFFSQLYKKLLSEPNFLVDYNHLNRELDRNMVREAFDSWSNVADLEFVESNHNPDISFLISYDNNFQKDINSEDFDDVEFNDGAADCLYENGQMIKCMIPYFYNYRSNQNYSEHFKTILHEIGHALGFSHPDDGEVTVNGTEASAAITLMVKGGIYKHKIKEIHPDSLDHLTSRQETFSDTTKAYKEEQYLSDQQEISPVTPMLYDIQAAQYLYGPNLEFHKGDDVYHITGEEKLFCIWDAGGTDTINTTSVTESVTLDLREGVENRNTVGESYFWIAFGANIENAVSGAGNDLIYGNNLGNVINAGLGQNTIYSGQGHNIFIFAGGKDLIKNFKVTDKLRIPAEFASNQQELFAHTKFTDNKIMIDFGTSGHITLEPVGEMSPLTLTASNVEFI